MEKPERKASRSRPLARHEQELWEQVTRHVKPMRPRPIREAGSTGASEGAKSTSGPVHARTAAPTPHSSQLKPLAPVEPNVRRRLSRGQSSPEAKIDLHGMRQAEAHAALRAFIHRAHADGVRLVLVVTGKGRPDHGVMQHEERGVLRRSVPHWLSAPDLRSAVLGFEEASRRHGGEGAFYVRLRASHLLKSRRPS